MLHCQPSVQSTPCRLLSCLLLPSSFHPPCSAERTAPVCASVEVSARVLFSCHVVMIELYHEQNYDFRPAVVRMRVAAARGQGAAAQAAVSLGAQPPSSFPKQGGLKAVQHSTCTIEAPALEAPAGLRMASSAESGSRRWARAELARMAQCAS